MGCGNSKAKEEKVAAAPAANSNTNNGNVKPPTTTRTGSTTATDSSSSSYNTLPGAPGSGAGSPRKDETAPKPATAPKESGKSIVSDMTSAVKAAVSSVDSAIKMAGYQAQYAGPDWQTKTAQEKRDVLFSRVTEDRSKEDWPNVLELFEILVESMNTVFDNEADDMPGQLALNAQERPKLTHSVGAIAPAKYVDLGGHPYTGIFKGSSMAFLRLSLARQFNLIEEAKQVSPSVTMKFMRSGVHSANVHAMLSLVGQASFNLFEHDLTNHLPMLNSNDPDISMPKKELLKTFSKASDWPCFLGLSDTARYDENGNEATAPEFPFRLIFHPVKKIHEMFPSEKTSEDPSYYIAQMEKLPVGTIFEIYAQPTPHKDDVIGPIGRVDILAPPSSTRFGDKKMFFQHTRMEEDLKLKPSWAADAKAIMDKQEGMIPTYYYPDLPWS